MAVDTRGKELKPTSKSHSTQHDKDSETQQ